MLKEFDHHQSPSPSPIKEVVVKAAERRSELVFFVEEERFGLEELLEGVADLRSQGFWSSLYVVRLNNGAVYGVKRLRKLNVSFEEFGRVMRRVGNLRHPNLLPLVSYNNTLDEKLLIYRFQRNGSLLDLFQGMLRSIFHLVFKNLIPAINLLSSSSSLGFSITE